MSSNIKLVQSEGKLNADFKVKKCIGNGSYGSVYLVKQKSDKTIHAIKKIKFDKIDDDFWVSGIRELKALHKARSHYVVEYRSAWIEKNCLCLQMEFCDNNLNDIIKDKSELFKSSVDYYELSLIDFFISCELFQEIIESLNFLHNLNPPIIHRDIKPENILVSYVINQNNKQFLKLCDFGYAKPHNFSGQSNTRDKGSISFMAPEVGQSKIYDSKSDVYSVALIGHHLFGIEFDRWDKSIEKKNKLIQHKYKQLEAPFNDTLQTRWRKRPSSAQLLSRSHDWCLNIKEIEAIHEFNTTIEIIRKYKQKFFYTFLISKMELRMSGTGANDQTDGALPQINVDSHTENKSEIEIEQVELKIGDIIQITYDGYYDVITLWALYVGAGSAMYLMPSNENENNYHLLREELNVITTNKTYVVNNLDEFAQTRGLTAQNANDIQKIAENLFKKYSNQDLNNENHNLRIHFVTKCRYGKGICPKKDSLEEETTIFQI